MHSPILGIPSFEVQRAGLPSALRTWLHLLSVHSKATVEAQCQTPGLNRQRVEVWGHRVDSSRSRFGERGPLDQGPKTETEGLFAIFKSLRASTHS